MTARSSRIASLDGLRAVSIALVLLGHVSGTHGCPLKKSILFASFAQLGVDVFFVISGFLITTLLQREYASTGTISLKNFYIRRAYRIWPAAYAYIAAIAVFWLLSGNLDSSALLIAATYATSITNLFTTQGQPWVLTHMWSLSVEELFYFIWPAALLFAFYRRHRIAFSVVLVVPLVRYLMVCSSSAANGGLSFPARADALAIGCLASIYREQITGTLSRHLTLLLIPLALGSSLVADHPKMFLLTSTLSQLSIAALTIHCIERRYWILNTAPVAWVGTLSYSLYLVQQPLLNRYSDWIEWPYNILLVVPVACVLHYGIEKPMLTLREKRSRSKAPVRSLHATACSQR